MTATVTTPREEPAPRRRVRPEAAAAVAGVALALLIGANGVGHTAGVVATHLREGHAYDVRYVGLLLVGLFLVQFGVAVLALAPFAWRGARWALFASAFEGVALAAFMAILIPVFPTTAGVLLGLGHAGLAAWAATRPGPRGR